MGEEGLFSVNTNSYGAMYSHSAHQPLRYMDSKQNNLYRKSYRTALQSNVFLDSMMFLCMHVFKCVLERMKVDACKP